ncbi:MAG: hypothetical protein HYR84_06360 [Planctomycetes bacterium]|nr:hypothetical protein [Planctomycetota bacterium]
MTDAVLTQLKILVERAVRPVQASLASKRKMREELLAHVTAVFEDEAKRTDEPTALERTAARFGSAAELTEQLQATVSLDERIGGWLESIVGFPPRGSMVVLALRHAGIIAALATVGLGLAMGTRAMITGGWGEWSTPTRMPATLAPLNFAALMFFASLLGQSMTRAWVNPAEWSWPRILALGVAAWLLLPAWLFLLCFAVLGELDATALHVAPLLLSSLLAPLVLVIVARMCSDEIRHGEEWASLKID